MQAIRRFSTRPASTLCILGLMLVTASGCASAASLYPEQEADPVGRASALDPPDTLHPTVDDAAIAALAHLAATTRRSELHRLQVGSIVGVEGAFSWQASGRPTTSRHDDWRPKARLSLAPDHVATFVIHPRTGDRRIDRVNERLTRGERRIVDELDPLHRPIYLLTPSGRVLIYRHGESTSEIAALCRARRSVSCIEDEQLADDAAPDAVDVALDGGPDRP